MTLTVGICDDCQEQIQLIKRFLSRYQDRFELKVISSTNTSEFHTHLKSQKPHLVFLDIDMGATSGIQLGEQIKAQYEDAIIVFITGHEEYALEAFRIRAFHYLLKPLTEEKFTKVFIEAVKKIQNEAQPKPEKKAFKLQRKGSVEYLDYDAINYFEKVGRKVTVNTKNGMLEFHGNFTQLLDEIDLDTFIQCHQGFIINKRKILAYREKNLVLEGNLQVPISRSYVAEIKEMLAKSLFAQEGGV